MATRANIAIPEERADATVYLYSHWDGDYLAETLASALAKHWRWSDSPYLARIIFDEMTKDAHGEETGYGISAELTDNTLPILVVDVANQRVLIVPEADARDGAELARLVRQGGYERWRSVPFAQYEDLDKAFREEISK